MGSAIPKGSTRLPCANGQAPTIGWLFDANSQQQAVFTPIELAKISERLRNQLAGVKVRPPLSTVETAFAEGSQDEISSNPVD